MSILSSELEHFIDAHERIILVEVAEARGSAPRESGAFLLVAASATLGTIGGGQLEYMMVDHARQMLRKSTQMNKLVIPLGPGIGQCCGGNVTIDFSNLYGPIAADLTGRVRAAEAARSPVFVFGAGHVGQALVRALAPLPFRVTLVDTRAELLAHAPARVFRKLSAMPEAIVKSAPSGAAFVAVTHDHALDFLITREALLRDDAHYVGMIGSRTKRTQFVRWSREQGDADALAGRLVCPIGAGIVADKRPEVIAALTIVEIIGTMPLRPEITAPKPTVPAKNSKGA